MNRLFLLIILFFSSFSVFIKSTSVVPLIDYSYQIENSYRIYLGNVVYKDIFLVLVPGLYFVMAFIMGYIGTSNYIFILFVILVQILTIIFSYKIIQQIIYNKKISIVIVSILIFTGQAIYPFPNYDITCVLFILIAIFYILRYLNKSKTILNTFFLGFLIILPSFFKQNIGLPFSIIIFMILSNLLYRDKKLFVFFILGYLFFPILFITYLFTNNAISDFLYQVFVFANKTRPLQLSIKINIYSYLINKNSYLCFLYFFSIFILNKIKLISLTNKSIIFCVLLYFLIRTFMFIELNNINGKFAINTGFDIRGFFNIFYDLILLLFLILIRNFKKTTYQDLIIYVSCIIVPISSFLSQGVFASSIGVIPILCIIIAFIIKKADFENKSFRNYFLCSTLFFLSITNYFVYTKNIRLSFISLRGFNNTSHIKDMEKLTTPGDWINDFEKLNDYIKKNIPYEDKIIQIPGEDPFYFISKRKPPSKYHLMNINTFDLSTNKFAKQIIKSDLKWIIFKIKTQCDTDGCYLNYISMLNVLKKHFIVINKFKNYLILKRKI